MCSCVRKIKVKLDYEIHFKGEGRRKCFRGVHVDVAPLSLRQPLSGTVTSAALLPLVP